MRVEDLPTPTEAQIELLEVVWQRGTATVADVWAALRARRRVARNTVQTTMARLEERGWLKAKRDAGAFVYAASVGRDAARARLVGRLAETAFGGSSADLVMSLLHGRGVTAPEAERIRRLIERAERRRP